MSITMHDRQVSLEYSAMTNRVLSTLMKIIEAGAYHNYNVNIPFILKERSGHLLRVLQRHSLPLKLVHSSDNADIVMQKDYPAHDFH